MVVNVKDFGLLFNKIYLKNVVNSVKNCDVTEDKSRIDGHDVDDVDQRIY